MSSRGGRRTGSGRKKIHASLSEGVKFWQRGHRRIWLDCQIYSLWVSAKIYCGYRSNSAFAAHLLSLERRRGKHLSFIFHKRLVPLLVPFLWLFPCSNSFSSLIGKLTQQRQFQDERRNETMALPQNDGAMLKVTQLSLL